MSVYKSSLINNNMSFSKEEVKIVKLYYTINNSDKKYFIKEVDGKSECPICRIVIKNVMLHLSKNFHCRKILLPNAKKATPKINFRMELLFMSDTYCLLVRVAS